MVDENPHIDLNAIKTLYSRSLYSIDSYDTEPVNKQAKVSLKKVLVLVREHIESGDPLYEFLKGILGACRLNMTDINLVTSFRQHEDYRQIVQQYGASVVIMFGLEAADIRLPVFFPHYQVQRHDGVVYISSPDLAVIENDKPEKQKLWQSLKKAFSL
jgi:hypothetical protein